MASSTPAPIPLAEFRRRRGEALRLARSLGFAGRVEYRHVYSQTGGAQYGRAAVAGGDLLTVYAEAFERDADPDDFSLRAVVAHERGHQLVARHAGLAPLTAGVSPAAEEVLASLLGALTVGDGPDRDALVEKAAFDLIRGGAPAADAAHIVGNLLAQLGGLL